MKSEIVNKLIRDARFKVKLHGTPLNNQIPLFMTPPPPPLTPIYSNMLSSKLATECSVCVNVIFFTITSSFLICTHNTDSPFLMFYQHIAVVDPSDRWTSLWQHLYLDHRIWCWLIILTDVYCNTQLALASICNVFNSGWINGIRYFYL